MNNSAYKLKFSVLFGFTLVSFLLGARPALAFRISPMVADFSIPAGGLSQVFTIENPSAEKVPLEIEVTSRVADENGEEKRIPSHEFSIYPEQLVLQAKEKRNLRITYTGPKDIKEEVPYRLIVTQLPVEFKGKKNDPKVKLNFLLQYVASLYVQPAGIKSSVRVKDYTFKNKNELEVWIENSGTKRQMLVESNLQMLDGENKEVLHLTAPKEIEGLNVLAGRARRVLLKVEKDLSTKVKHMSLSFKNID